MSSGTILSLQAVCRSVKLARAVGVGCDIRKPCEHSLIYWSCFFVCFILYYWIPTFFFRFFLDQKEKDWRS